MMVMMMRIFQLQRIWHVTVASQLIHGKSIGLGQFAYVSDEEASRLIRNLQPKTSPLDYIPISILNDCSVVFGPIIASLANLSLTEGKFPNMFTVGEVMPLLKKPGVGLDDMSNYRPITNLNTIEKLLGRLAQAQLRKHIESSTNAAPLQSSYHVLQSTETAMMGVISDLLSTTNSKTPSGLLSLDIERHVRHFRRLLDRSKKLFGFNDTVLQWWSSYLAGRSQFVSIEGRHSSTVAMTTSVP